MVLCKTPETGIDFILHPHPYMHLYNRLKNILDQEEFNFFSEPNLPYWKLPITDIDTNYGVSDFSKLSDEEKDEISDYIENVKTKILKKFAEDTTFRNIKEKMFDIPNESNIKVVKSESCLYPILTLWGCKSNTTSHSINSVSRIIERPRSNSAKITLFMRYTDGTKAEKKKFYIDYLDGTIEKRTDRKAQFLYGRMILGAKFSVYDIINGHKEFIQNYEVTETGEFTFEVIFPLLSSGEIRVENQKGTALKDREVIVEIEDASIETDKIAKTYKTDLRGKIDLEYLEVGKQIKISESTEPDNNQIHTIISENNKYKIIIHTPLPTTATVVVEDEETGEALSDYPIISEYEGNTEEYRTDENKIAIIDNLIVDKEIKIWDKNNPNNTQIHSLQEQNNDYVLKVHIDKPTDCTVTVEDQDTGEKQANYPIIIEYEGSQKHYKTNADGVETIGDIIIGKEIKIYDNNNIENYQVQTVEKTGNDYVLKVYIHKPKFFDILVIEKKYFFPIILAKKKVIKNIQVDFIDSNGDKITRTTSEEGFCKDLPEDNFNNNKKIIVYIHIPRKNKKDKIIKKKFKFRK